MMEFMSLRALEIGTERRQEVALETMRAARGRQEQGALKSETVVEASTAPRSAQCETAPSTVPEAWPSST